MPPLHYDFEQVCTGQILNNPTQFNNCYFCALLQNIRSSHRESIARLDEGLLQVLACNSSVTNRAVMDAMHENYHQYTNYKFYIKLLAFVSTNEE